MNINLKEPWFVKVVAKISQILFLLTIFGVCLYFVSSRQGLSADDAYLILTSISIICFINIILLFINLVSVVLKNKRVTFKIKSVFYLSSSLIFTVGVFIFVNSIFILSKGSLE